MTKMKHTPGPWEPIILKNDDGHIIEAGIEATGINAQVGSMAFVLLDNIDPDCDGQVEADCRLMSAGPELLAVCESIVELFEACKAGHATGHGHGAANWYATSGSFEKKFAGMKISPELIAAAVAAVAKAKGGVA